MIRIDSEFLGKSDFENYQKSVKTNKRSVLLKISLEKSQNQWCFKAG